MTNAEATEKAAMANTQVTPDDKLIEEKKKWVLKWANIGLLLQVLQHVSDLMTFPVLMKQLCGGDVAKTTSLLANVQGITGVLSVILFQIGGKLSDMFGRKPFATIGCVANMANGIVMATYGYKRRNVAVMCRVAKMIATTFSGSVIGGAACLDVFTGAEFGAIQGGFQAIVGAAVILGPTIEAAILKRTNNDLRVPYLLFSLEASLGLLSTAVLMPETLTSAKRAAVNFKSLVAAANPFGFVRIFTSKNRVLKQLTGITMLQTMVDGKNISDLHQIWAVNHLKMDFAAGRLFQQVYGSANILSGMFLLPFLLKRLSVRSFTTLANLSLAVAFSMRASEKRSVYFSFIVPALPGVNGASTYALGGLFRPHCLAEGFGMGEFSAWNNNIRALMCAFAATMYGNVYAWAVRTGRHPGLAWFSAAFFGGFMPEVCMQMCKDIDKAPAQTEEKK
mmetsp:Transcript_142420/g.262512  ORF Transcript_142420/g.262512 Transcript_142420/m.262512 type:complete len:450 (-) Transcript_142420:150-1499(-)